METFLLDKKVICRGRRDYRSTCQQWHVGSEDVKRNAFRLFFAKQSSGNAVEVFVTSDSRIAAGLLFPVQKQWVYSVGVTFEALRNLYVQLPIGGYTVEGIQREIASMREKVLTALDAASAPYADYTGRRPYWAQIILENNMERIIQAAQSMYDAPLRWLEYASAQSDITLEDFLEKQPQKQRIAHITHEYANGDAVIRNYYLFATPHSVPSIAISKSVFRGDKLERRAISVAPAFHPNFFGVMVTPDYAESRPDLERTYVLYTEPFIFSAHYIMSMYYPKQEYEGTSFLYYLKESKENPTFLIFSVRRYTPRDESIVDTSVRVTLKPLPFIPYHDFMLGKKLHEVISKEDIASGLLDDSFSVQDTTR